MLRPCVRIIKNWLPRNGKKGTRWDWENWLGCGIEWCHLVLSTSSVVTDYNYCIDRVVCTKKH